MRTLIVIVLGIVLIIAVYWLYRYAIRANQPLEKISLGSVTTVPEPGVSGSATTSSVGYYTFWLYVNSWTSGQKVILEKKTGTAEYIRLFLHETKPELICTVKPGSSTSSGTSGSTDSTSTSSTQRAVLHRNFPLQRWTHVVLAFDSNVMDCYIDGKLVTSVPLNEVIAMDSSNNILGGSGADIFMTGFVKKTSRATPDIAQSEYSKSRVALQTELPNYNVDVSLVKNGEVTKQFSLL